MHQRIHHSLVNAIAPGPQARTGASFPQPVRSPGAYACEQPQLTPVHVTVSQPCAVICIACVKPWMFEMSYACAVNWLPVSRLNSPCRVIRQRVCFA